VRAKLFHAGRRADGQTNLKKLIVAFRNFSKAHKIYGSIQSACALFSEGETISDVNIALVTIIYIYIYILPPPPRYTYVV
jgi:hypothetical protein